MGKRIPSWLTAGKNTPVHFACVKDSDEDRGNIEYQRDVATQAGLATRFVYVEDIGWADEARRFVDDEGTIIDVLCKLYPWEWLIHDEFGPRAAPRPPHHRGHPAGAHAPPAHAG